MLTLAEYNALLAHCGCCPVPRCCPPLLECRSAFARMSPAGFAVEGSGSSDMPVRHLRKRFHGYAAVPADWVDTYPHSPPGGDPAATWVSRTVADTRYHDVIEEYDQPFHASLGGAAAAGSCLTDDAVLATTCAFGGTLTETYYSIHYETDAWVRFRSQEIVENISSAEGLETEAFAAWRSMYPTDADYDNAAAAYQDYLDAYAAWEAGGMIGEPPEPVDPPVDRPEETYPACWARVEAVTTRWQRANHGSGWVTELIPSTESSPNPSTFVSYTDSPVGFGGDLLHELPVTREDFIAACEAWVGDHASLLWDGASDSSSGPCAPGSNCRAERSTYFIGEDEYYAEDWFSYRFKLNKCCGYKRVLSAWREVFFPLAYLLWLDQLAALDSGETPPPAPADLDSLAARKQWLWEGVPPLCPENEDSDSLNDTDPYDHEPMWSPWSLNVRIPPGEMGLTVLRNYLQYCGPALPDLMPDVTGHLDLSDSQPDEP